MRFPAARTPHKFAAPFFEASLSIESVRKKAAWSSSFFMSLRVSTLSHVGVRVTLAVSILYCVAGKKLTLAFL